MSGGEQQRVSIARGLINNPKVLLLDEPLSALDQKLRKSMQLELKQLQKKLGITFIYVTHSQDEALTMSDRIVLLKDGVIEQVDTPVKIYEHPKSLYTAQFLGDSNLFQGDVIEVEKDYTRVKVEDTTLKILSQGFEVGDSLDIILRPENMKTSLEPSKDNVFQGKITEQIYDGAVTNLMVRVNKKKINVMYLGNDKLYTKGQEIYLTWDIEDAIVLKRDYNEE